jgi:hypothetical protein
MAWIPRRGTYDPRVGSTSTITEIIIINDREVIQAIQAAPEKFERNLKRNFGKVAGELRKDTLQELQKHQESSWILEKAIAVKVRGSMKDGFMSVKQGITSNVKVPGKVQPNEYGYLIEHGNTSELVAERDDYGNIWTKSGVNQKWEKRVRFSRPFLEPARVKFIDSGIGEVAIEQAIAETVKQFNEGA